MTKDDYDIEVAKEYTTLQERIADLEKENTELKEELNYAKTHCLFHSDCPTQKENAELEKEISVLLSCKNCPENKGGFICAKEYEGKCLSQKIQYIKELKEENKVLAQNLEDTEICEKTLKDKVAELEKENAELKKTIEHYRKEREFFIGEVEK